MKYDCKFGIESLRNDHESQATSNSKPHVYATMQLLCVTNLLSKILNIQIAYLPLSSNEHATKFSFNASYCYILKLIEVETNKHISHLTFHVQSMVVGYFKLNKKINFLIKISVDL